MSEEIEVTIHTLGGAEVVLGSYDDSTPMRTLKLHAAQALQRPVFAVRLLIDGDFADTDSASSTLADAGLVPPVATLGVSLVPVDVANPQQLYDNFRLAIQHGNIAEASQLADQGAGHDAEGNLLRKNGCTILHLAIRARMVELAKYIVAQGVNLEDQNETGRTPLVQATVKKLPEVVDVLLSAKADINAADRNSRNAWSYAVSTGQDATGVLLYNAGAIVDRQGGAVMDCCRTSMGQTTLALLEAEYPVGTLDEFGRTELHYAYGNQLGPEVIAALVAAGADENQRDNDGWLPKEGIRPIELVPTQKARQSRGNKECLVS